MTPQAAGRTAPNHIRMRSQRLEQLLRERDRIANQMAARIRAATINAVENVLLRLLSETFQFGDFSFLARLFELLDGFDSEFVMEKFDLFRPDAGYFEHGNQARRGRRAQFLVIGQLS